jgi:hypothetical protein
MAFCGEAEGEAGEGVGARFSAEVGAEKIWKFSAVTSARGGGLKNANCKVQIAK